MLLVCGSMAFPALSQQVQQDLQCTFVDQPVVKGDIFINYGSVTDAYSVRSRSSISVGEPAISNGVLSPKNAGQFGYWSRFYVPPIGPIVTATQGELLDRIQVSWQPNPLGAQATDGFKLYRDSTYLALVDSKTRNYNDFNVIAGRAYTYEVRGINAYGEGSPGFAVGFQTPNGTVTGWVQTPSGNPVPDAIVALTPLQGFSARFGPADGAFAYSNKGVADTLIPLNNGEWTLSFWVKTTQADADAGIISLHPFPIYMRPMASAGGNEGIEVAQTATSTALLSGQFPAAKKNDWNHIAFTMDDNDNGRLYINGTLVGLSPVPPVESAEELRIGARTEAPGAWAGCLDELRLYHRRLDELDLGEVMMGTASSQTPNLKYYWKMDEELGTGSFDILKRNKLYFCGAVFDTTRPMVRTMGKTNQEGYYRIESASYGTGTTFLAEPMKDFYMYRALKFTRDSQHYAVLPDFSLTSKATLEMWVNSAGPDNDDQCLLSKTWPGNEFRLLLRQNGIDNHIWVYLNGQEHDFGSLGMGYQHLAFAIDSLSGAVTAYKNGIALGSHTFTGVTGNWSDPNSSWLLGARPSGMGRTDYYGGLIDEVALYDTTLSAARILDHVQNGREMTEKGLRVYFSLDEGSGKRLNNSGSVLLPAGTNIGAAWTPFAARQKTEPHIFTPSTRQVTLNPSVTSVDQVDFIDRSTIPVSGYVRYKNTDCFAKNVEILVDSLPYSPRIFTDANGKFVVDFDPGKTATLTPVFEDHEFVPAFWEVTNVVNPIAGILFNDITTRKVQGVVAGGLCRKSVIEPPPGTGQGTVCRVEVRSTDDCLLRWIIIDNQEGNYLFEELPPLEAMTVSVAEHSNDDIKAAFQTQGGSTVNLSKRDTIIDFIYFAPPQVALNSGLEPLPNCSPPVIVLDQGENVQLSISLIEQYVPILDNMNQVVDDGVCPLDTADFEIINGLADLTLDTAMSNKVLIYRFKVGGPNTSPPYLKTLQIIGTSLAGRKGSLVKQAIVTGEKQKLPSFTTKLPEKPIHVLHDPPGDGSYAFLEKDSSICYTTGVSLAADNSIGNENTFNLVPTITTAIGFWTGFSVETEIKTIAGSTIKFLKTNSRLTDSTFQTCLKSSQRISTDDGDLIVGARGGADVFMGVAQNIIFSRIDKVLFNFDSCSARVEESVAVAPGEFATTFIYSEFNIKNYVIPNLGLLLNDPTVTPADSADYEKSIADWQKFLDANNARKQAVQEDPPERNISFDAGASYEFSETIEVTQTSNVQFDTISAQEVGEALGLFGNDAGDQNTIIFSTSSSYGSSKGTEEQNSLTTGYVLKDDDPGDFFSVDVGIDKDYNTPIFNLRAGQSSCPWEPGTANREEPNLNLDAGSQFKAINVPANEPAVFNLRLGNGSASSESWTYGFTAIPANNPHGAVIKLNGQPLNNNTIKFIVPWGTSIPVTLTIERGPVAYEYDSLLVAQVSECEMARNYALSLSLTGDPAEPRFFSPLYLGVDFIRPCSEVNINVPEQNWVVINNDPNQPGTIRRITASGYNLSNPDFQLVRVQYRRSDGNGAWINLPTPDGIFEAFNPNWSGFYNTQTDTFRIPGPDTLLLGPSFTQFFWETDGLGDGLYEIHAWAVCTGDASGKPGFSEIIKGRIDREPPSIVGVPQPSDGVYHVGDEISFTFNQHINCDKLIKADQTQPNNVGLYNTNATTDDLIDIDFTCFENKIVLDPTFENKFYENRILRAELHGIQDLVGNEFNGTKFNNGIWEFYVDRNELAWLTDSLGLTKFEDENKTATAHIHNRGGYPVPFKILGVPDWVHVSPNQGTLAPNEIRPVSFSVDSTLAFGYWSDTIVLETQTGQNPFFMGGSEPLPLGVRVVCRPPYGPTDFSQFANAMGMVLKVNIEYVFSTDPEDMVAAYVDEELRGLTKVQYFPQINAYLAYLNVYGDSADLLKPVRLEVWDASECERYGSVQESFTFQPDNIVGILTNPQVIHTGGLLLREVPIKDGWNWLSFNLAFPDNSLNAALSSLQHPENDLMRSQTAISQYLGGWFGSLTNLNNTAMYIYRADVADTLRMQGTLIDPDSTPIPLAAGWNWVGYVPNYALPINDALASLPAQFGDIAKGQYSFAQYINPAFGWVGTLKYMAPPNGYQLKLAQAGTLTYPPPPSPFVENQTEARGDTEPAPMHWTVNPTRFEHSSTLIGMIRSNGANATTSDMELGAFVGNEVRGTAQVIYIEPLDAHLFFLTTYANTPGELVRFKLYDDADASVRDLSETMNFAPNQHQGNIENPVPFELLATRAEEDFGTTLGFDVQPNPFATETTLRFNLPKAEEVLLTISDAQGREVARRPISAVAGPNVATWNGRSDTGNWLSSGVYTVQLKTAAGSVVRKVVLQRLP